jgi:rhomboid protease GlpG
MRQIGSIRDEAQARLFSDFLVSRGVRNEIEREADGQWSVWIHDDDHIRAAESGLARFVADPNAAEFRNAAAEAAKVRQAEAEDLAAYRKRIRSRRSIFPKFGGHGVGILTYLLILASIVVSFLAGTALTEKAQHVEFLRHVFISDPMTPGRSFLPEVLKGEVWRLITPIFIHFGPLHLIFNMMWLYQLGCMIEVRQGTFRLASLVLVIGVLSDVAQYWVGGWIKAGSVSFYFATAGANFGGMSGVVYGLAGYVWIRGRDDRGSGLYLDPQSVTILLIWLAVCFMGLMGHVANTAHLTGLVVGMAWGWISARLTPGKRE